MAWLVIAQVAGGVVLFLLGMQWLSTALRAAAGERLRTMLTAATASRVRGLALGSAVGFLAHSTAATVMTVGFVHAGLLSLAAALPVLFGANIGTTLSMQLISFRLTDYALAAIAVGGVGYLTLRPGRMRLLGQALLGFGLLFYGMKISGDAIVPYRDTLAPWLARIDGSTLGGLLAGAAAALVVTALVQSSGAVIGMTFVLAGAGVFTSLWQTFPIVLGAHVGTTVTTLVVAIGTSAEARRAALANLGFNLFNAAIGVAGARVLVPLLEATGPNVVHQTANAHTAVMIIAAALVLPITGWLAGWLRRLAWPRAPEPVLSHLELRLLALPDAALQATMHELGRCTNLALESFRIVLAAVERPLTRAEWRAIQRNEESINQIRTSVRSFLASLARRELAHRQALLAQALNRCAIEIERIGDHVERLGELVTDGRRPRFDAPIQPEIAQLSRQALGVVELVERSFAADQRSIDTSSWATLEARNRYRTDCSPVKRAITERLSRREVPPALALAFSEIATTLDRIVRHCAVIAQEQRQPEFAFPRERGPAPGC